MKLILGLGVTGLSIARFLSKQKIAYKIADSRTSPELLPKYQSEFPNLTPILGAWQADLLTDVGEIFISPGVAQKEAIVIQARAQSIPITSDIELFSRFNTAPIIGITGSNGKSTVTQLLTEMIISSGKNASVCGNIGKPVLDCLADEVDFYVLELSSYQLDYTQNLNLITGVVLNIAPDHLDRYDSFADYAASKLSLYDYCQQGVFNLAEKLTPNGSNGNNFSLNIPNNSEDFGSVVCHDKRYLLKGDTVLLDTEQIPLIGEHNIVNVLAALTLGNKIGLQTEAMIDCIKTFKGLPHRLEWVAKKHGIDYYNDSKATNATATLSAISGLLEKHTEIALIIGGVKKAEDYRKLFSLIDQHISVVVLIGESAKTFAKQLHRVKTHRANSLPEAVQLAAKFVRTANSAVLLSPACASFDMFDDFEQRGEVFKQFVNRL